MKVDLNCDMGESFGAYQLGQDEQMFTVITSANIACGWHAGDASTMRRSVERATQHGVSIGAHPGLPDLHGFGRREMDITAQEAYDMVVYQVGALYGFAKAQGTSLRHVKPHGALYNMAARNPELATSIARAVKDVDPQLVLFGLSGSQLVKAGHDLGLQVAHEVFADRTYQSDGSLTPRKHPNALIHDPKEATDQVIRMIQEGVVHSVQGVDVPIQADTLCIHGDGAHAYIFAKTIRERLQLSGIEIGPR